MPDASSSRDLAEQPTRSGAAPSFLHARLVRLLIVLAGIVCGQLIIYGPSLLGWKILLPLDHLGVESFYLPQTPGAALVIPHNFSLSDLVLQFEPDRRFAAGELRAGRFPFWAPYQYAGAPFVWPKYSPFLLFGCLTPSPVILAWAQLFEALVAGLGAYCFLRRAMGSSFWAAAIPAWCYPLTGFFVFWQGFPTCMAAYWLPWILLAVTGVIRRPGVRSLAGLSVATALVLVSGHIDVAGQVLLVSGLYAIWCWLDCFRREWKSPAAVRAIVGLIAGWSLGFMLGAPHLLPILEYAKTGARMAKRSAGVEERPPGAFSALPLAFLPDLGGSPQAASVSFAPIFQVEGLPAGYAGIIAMLFAAPLAWLDRRRRSSNLFWIGLTVLGFAWGLGLPVIVSILRLPGLNMMSHNRLVFASSFAWLAMASTGLDVLREGSVRRCWWFGLPLAALTALCGHCLWRSMTGPSEIAAFIEPAIRSGRAVQWIRDMADVAVLRHWFRVADLGGAVLSGTAATAWVLLLARPDWFGRGLKQPAAPPRSRGKKKPSPRSQTRPVAPLDPRWVVGSMGAVMLADLLWFAHGRSAQCDPALYYPRIPALEQIARSVEGGRVIGFKCLPAQLSQTHGLNDVRGYDSIDPSRMIELLNLTAVPDFAPIPYAAVQWLTPNVEPVQTPPGGVRVSPILDLLGVRYVIFRGQPFPGWTPQVQSPDYYAYRNFSALPRAFVPRQVKVVANSDDRLAVMAAKDFDPRAVAYVEAPLSLDGEARGTAEINAETPTRLTISVQMETPGLVVLADQWDPGWRATIDGRPAPIVRADHALRGVTVPAGKAVLEFRYASRTVFYGFVASAAAVAILAGLWIAGRRKSQSP